MISASFPTNSVCCKYESRMLDLSTLPATQRCQRQPQRRMNPRCNDACGGQYESAFWHSDRSHHHNARSKPIANACTWDEMGFGVEAQFQEYSIERQMRGHCQRSRGEITQEKPPAGRFLCACCARASEQPRSTRPHSKSRHRTNSHPEGPPRMPLDGNVIN